MSITHCHSNYVGIKWLQLAREKLKVGDKAAKFLPGGIQEVDKNVQDAKKIHDHYLEKVRFLFKISFKPSFHQSSFLNLLPMRGIILIFRNRLV